MNVTNQLKHGVALFVAVLALSFPSVVSAASPTFVNCAVALDPGYDGLSPVIRAYGSPRGQFDMLTVGGTCSELINSGAWVGVSKYGEWQTKRGGVFMPACTVTWPWTELVLWVYSSPGYRSWALADCGQFSAQPYSSVFYFYEGQPY